VSDARALLVADVLTRALELRGAQVVLTHVTADSDPLRLAESDGLGKALGLHPPAARIGTAPDAASITGQDIVVAGDLVPLPPEAAGVRVQVGWAALPGPLLDFAASNGIDPLAIRSALLVRPRHEPQTLHEHDCLSAFSALKRWRRLVADWAIDPSRPIPAAVRQRADACLDDDLDVAGLMSVLTDVEADPGPATGAKFETFVYLDRVLGLDLARHVGA
jgi:hypothetical protein